LDIVKQNPVKQNPVKQNPVKQNPVKQNPVNQTILDRLPTLGILDVWLVSGGVFQTVWNHQTHRPLGYGIKDYDIFYFDPDTSYEAEDEVIRRFDQVFSDLDVDVEVRNQARVHLWFPQKFGRPYQPLRCTCDGIDRFLATACMIGIDANGVVYAPAGLEDMVEMRLHPNYSSIFSAVHYEKKAKRWKTVWPELTVAPATEHKMKPLHLTSTGAL